uniref:Uncharacterized protein n=1 Tax=Plectus sambesii TaxID=2011161 RepID=A0A914XK87_9BILA
MAVSTNKRARYQRLDDRFFRFTTRQNRPASAPTLTPTGTRRVTFDVGDVCSHYRRPAIGAQRSPRTKNEWPPRRSTAARRPGARETAVVVGRRSTGEERKDVAGTLGAIETAQVTSDATGAARERRRRRERRGRRWRPSPDSAPVNNANAGGTQRGAQVD